MIKLTSLWRHNDEICGKRSERFKKLNTLYQDEGFQFVVIYGRRRVGKTMLINEFLKGKRQPTIWQ